MKILFVAFPHSIHTARWIMQVTDQGWDVHLYPSDQWPLHEKLQGKVNFHKPTLRLSFLRRALMRLLMHWPTHRGSGHLRRMIHRLEKREITDLGDLIQHIQPDMVHSLEIQHAGYLTHAAKRKLGAKFPTWLVTNWGSDVYLFGQLEEHREQVKAVLRDCDYYACECERDIAIAQGLGFSGKVLTVLPAGGGFDLDDLLQYRTPGKVSERKVIILKGYQHWAGRAMVGLRAIEMCAEEIKAGGYRVLVPLANPDMRIAAEVVANATGLQFEYPIHGPYEGALERFGSARIHIGLSISDGISQSFLESMVLGAFPIQSGTACADEWITDGETGFVVPPNDPHIVADALRKALADDALVDEAAAKNWQTCQERLAYPIVKAQAVALYERVYSETQQPA
ncbi:MAG: hypothetical protein CL610_07565 [Anaerolineaceae bacterium]|nr:hypothetical protein [Anaerolineaceae bacterium]